MHDDVAKVEALPGAAAGIVERLAVEIRLGQLCKARACGGELRLGLHAAEDHERRPAHHRRHMQDDNVLTPEAQAARRRGCEAEC
eukprot:364849-Chlamydomonas_euryale.AAC.10